MVVFLVALEVLVKVIDPLGQKGDLHRRRTCILRMDLECTHDLCFFIYR